MVDLKITPSTTYFAPAERARPSELERQIRLFSDGMLKTLMDAMINYVLILNGNREAVFANEAMKNALNMQDGSRVYGARPGELFSCEQSLIAPNGCGTGKECRHCSAVMAILSALNRVQSEEKCRIISRSNGEMHALDLQIHATPFEQDGELFVIFAMEDITQQQRLRILERTFFHDVLNTAGALRGIAETLEEDSPPFLREDMRFFRVHLGGMVDEITAHKDFLAAENGEIVANPVEIKLGLFLEAIQNLYQGHELAKGKKIELDCGPSLSVVTDSVLLNRVVGNLLKNALEAEKEGAAITIGCKELPDRVRIEVRNSTVIARKYQGGLLKGGFSTKGGSRGIGLYSSRLLAERYLKGALGFASNEQTGTAFHVDLPLKLPVSKGRSSEI